MRARAAALAPPYQRLVRRHLRRRRGPPLRLLLNDGMKDSLCHVSVEREQAAQGVEPLGGQALLFQRQAAEEVAHAVQHRHLRLAARAVHFRRQRASREGLAHLRGGHAGWLPPDPLHDALMPAILISACLLGCLQAGVV